MRHLSLDETLPDGRSVHELIADPHSLEACDEPADAQAIGPDGESDVVPGAVALMDAAARARDLERRASAAESDALALRDEATRETARLITLANMLTQAIAAEDLVRLSPQQLAIVRARIELIGDGEEPTHHAVARRLGLTPAAVSRQWARVLTKLAARQVRAVSTSAA